MQLADVQIKKKARSLLMSCSGDKLKSDDLILNSALYVNTYYLTW